MSTNIQNTGLESFDIQKHNIIKNSLGINCQNLHLGQAKSIEFFLLKSYWEGMYKNDVRFVGVILNPPQLKSDIIFACPQSSNSIYN